MINRKLIKYTEYKGLKVYYVPHLDGGGTSFGQDFIPIIRKHFGKVGRICEFCSGPGFIGFSLLAHGLCDSLCLVDINKDAIEACNHTIKQNGLSSRVKAYVSNGLKDVPKSEKWDIIVSNPPHLSGTEKEYGFDIIAIDPKWRIHKEFYENAAKYLKPGGSILFVENDVGSNPQQWKALIGKHGRGLSYKTSFYYQGEKRSNGSIPKVFIERMVESVRDGTALSNGLDFYVHNFKKVLNSAYKQSKFYYVWSRKKAAR